MTVRELISRLAALPPDLPVCLADWQEQYQQPSESQTEQIKVVRQHYLPKGADTAVIGEFVRLGSDYDYE